jgi:carboxyl-terminal processing protease
MVMAQPRRTNRPRTSRALLLILGVAVVGSTLALAQRGDGYRFFDPLIEVKNIINTFAVEEPDLDELQAGAIDGMLEALDDPYATYVPPAFGDEFEKELTGEYVGIGAEVNQVDGVFTIVTPMDDSPAFRAGIMSGDKVVAIDGEPTEGETVEQSIERLLGEAGTQVVLTIDRSGEPLEITITRAQIKARAVRGFRRSPGGEASWDYTLDPVHGIGYIRVSQFTPSVASEFEEALRGLGAHDGDLRGLVIDVRWNPGGLLDQAIRMSDLLLDEGVIVSTNGRAYDERVASARAEGTLPEFPVAVLINGQSASASEVLAGALVENGRAITVGERSFGKGSVQSIHPLGGAASGASLKLTEQRYYLPSGRSLQRTDESAEWGVDPSPGYFVPVGNDEVREMFEVRRQAEIVGGEADEIAEPSGDPAWIEGTLKDRQLAEAVRAVRHHIEQGSWPEPSGDASDTGVEVSVQELERLQSGRNRLLRDLARIDRRVAALRSAAGDEADRATRDFWSDSISVEGGTIVVRDAGGEIVAELIITGDSLERWLLDAELEPVAPGGGQD